MEKLRIKSWGELDLAIGVSRMIDAASFPNNVIKLCFELNEFDVKIGNWDDKLPKVRKDAEHRQPSFPACGILPVSVNGEKIACSYVDARPYAHIGRPFVSHLPGIFIAGKVIFSIAIRTGVFGCARFSARAIACFLRN